MTSEQAKSLSAFIACVKAGGHDWSADNACTRCGARKGDPSIADILVAAHNDRPILPWSGTVAAAIRRFGDLLDGAIVTVDGKPADHLYRIVKDDPIRCVRVVPPPDGVADQPVHGREVTIRIQALRGMCCTLANGDCIGTGCIHNVPVTFDLTAVVATLGAHREIARLQSIIAAARMSSPPHPHVPYLCPLCDNDKQDQPS